MIVSIVGGTGPVGTALGARLAAAGHSITICSRDSASERAQQAMKKVQAAAGNNGTCSSAAIREGCDQADVVLITVPGLPTAKAMSELAESMGPCTGKPLIDATNPLTAWPELNISADRNATSSTEEFAKVFPECAGVYKAFNTVGVDILANPIMENGAVSTMMFAGPPKAPLEDGKPFDLVQQTIEDAGFEAMYVGPQRQARNLESIAEMWIHMAIKYKDLPYQSSHSPTAFSWNVLFR